MRVTMWAGLRRSYDMDTVPGQPEFLRRIGRGNRAARQHRHGGLGSTPRPPRLPGRFLSPYSRNELFLIFRSTAKDRTERGHSVIDYAVSPPGQSACSKTGCRAAASRPTPQRSSRAIVWAQLARNRESAAALWMVVLSTCGGAYDRLSFSRGGVCLSVRSGSASRLRQLTHKRGLPWAGLHLHRHDLQLRRRGKLYVAREQSHRLRRKRRELQLPLHGRQHLSGQLQRLMQRCVPGRQHVYADDRQERQHRLRPRLVHTDCGHLRLCLLYRRGDLSCHLHGTILLGVLQRRLDLRSDLSGHDHAALHSQWRAVLSTRRSRRSPRAKARGPLTTGPAD